MRVRILHLAIVAAIAAISCTLAGAASARTLDNGEAMITGVSPQQAIAGQLVTISGQNLDGTRSVSFGSVGAQSMSVDTDGMWVKAVVPAGVKPGLLYITLDNAGNPASTGPYKIVSGSVPPAAVAAPPPAKPAPVAVATHRSVSKKVLYPPSITVFSPTAGPVGSRVRIAGTHLGGVKWVKFGGVRAHIMGATPTGIIAVVPKRAHSGKIAVHAAGGTNVTARRFVVTLHARG
jgi:hypothetical protein